MTTLPNPFLPLAVETSPHLSTAREAAAEPYFPTAAAVPEFDHDATDAISLDELCDRGFDVDAFMLELEESPLFLRADFAGVS